MDWNRLDLQPRVAAGLRRGEEALLQTPQAKTSL